jgi:hypothetical protein
LQLLLFVVKTVSWNCHDQPKETRMRVIVVLLMTLAIATPTVAGHVPSRGVFQDCLAHGGDRDVCRCLATPQSC